VSQASPVDFCNQYSLRARPRDRPNPRSTTRCGFPGLRRAGGTSGWGLAPSATSNATSQLAEATGIRVIPAPVLAARASRPELRAHRRYQPRFREPGAARQRRSATPVRGGGFLATARSRELYPDPFRSSTPCHRVVVAPVGGPVPNAVERPKLPDDSIDTAARANHERACDDEVPRDHVSGSGPRRTRRLRSLLTAPVPPEVGGCSEPSARSRPLSRSEPVSARSRPTPLSRREPQGPRAASPAAPRRALGSAAPEVLSIDEPP